MVLGAEIIVPDRAVEPNQFSGVGQLAHTIAELLLSGATVVETPALESAKDLRNPNEILNSKVKLLPSVASLPRVENTPDVEEERFDISAVAGSYDIDPVAARAIRRYLKRKK